MAPTMLTETTVLTATSSRKPPRPRQLVCFSFAAYAKSVVHRLSSQFNIPIIPGLNDDEFALIESTFNFTFPPDLRSVLREGLPVGPSFPNWRSSSLQQLHIQLNLPFLSLSKNITVNGFWSDSWGRKPECKKEAVSLIKELFCDKAPALVPVYRNCYVPSSPNMAGNPVFYIDSDEVRVLSFDLTGFFKEIDHFLQLGSGDCAIITNIFGRNSSEISDHLPVWAAKEARRIEFWTDVAERGRKMVARSDTHGWWNWITGDESGLGCCLEEVFWRLRDGGWREDEVREMMLMDGCDESVENSGAQSVVREEKEKYIYREGVTWQVGSLSRVLLRAGWTMEDALYSLDLQDDRNSSYINVDK